MWFEAALCEQVHDSGPVLWRGDLEFIELIQCIDWKK